MKGETDQALMSPDYHGSAIPTADQLLDAKGLGGNHTETFDDMDAWFKAHVADRKPLDKEIMHRAERWGAVEELRRGKPLAEGALFPNTAGGHGDNGPLQNETLAWLELVSVGTFGEESLRSHAISFQENRPFPRFFLRFSIGNAEIAPLCFVHFNKK